MEFQAIKYTTIFRDQINIPSKVNSDDTLDEDEIENDLESLNI